MDFKDYDLKTTADYSTFTGKDGAVYGKLDMNRYMAQFIMDRFIDFEIEQPQAKGLKIPVSAVTEKNFYMLPKSYAAQGGDSMDIGFNKEIYDANGTSILLCLPILALKMMNSTILQWMKKVILRQEIILSVRSLLTGTRSAVHLP